MRYVIGVIGGSSANNSIKKIAYEVGYKIAEKGGIVVCGGLGGVMESAAKGAKEAGGLTIGILPGRDKDSANKYIDIKIATGIGEARNFIIVNSSDGLIAVDGEFGTLSEIAFSLKRNKPIVGIKTFDIKGIKKVDSAEDAVNTIFKMIKGEK